MSTSFKVGRLPLLNLLEPRALWLLLLLPIIIVLHFVRQRKRQQEVSALFLWQEAKRLARRQRRISPTLLLLLQLLFATLLALALTQPRLLTRGAPPRVLVIDASASMSATEPSGTRLRQAVTQAEALLEGAGEVAVVRAGLGARVLQPLTGDHAAVQAALGGLEAGDAAAAVDDALALGRSLSPDAELHLFSDEGLPAGLDDVVVHPVGAPAPNLAISAFGLSYGQLFISVSSNLPRPQEVTLVIERSGATAEVREVLRTTLRVPAQGQAETSLPALSESGLYRAYLEELTGDALALDNEAFAGTRSVGVRLQGGVLALERVLQALPGTELGGADAAVTVLVGNPARLPPGDVVLFSAASETPRYREIADWVRSDPLLRFVDLTGVVVAPSAAPLPLPLEDADVLAKTADLTPVLLRWRNEARDVLLFRFHPSQSDLSRRPAFPILLANTLEALRGEATAPLGTALTANTWLTEPGRLEVEGRTYTSAPLPTRESQLSVTALVREVAETGGSSQAVRNPALWLVLVALLLLLSEWLLWLRGRRTRVTRRLLAGR